MASDCVSPCCLHFGCEFPSFPDQAPNISSFSDGEDAMGGGPWRADVSDVVAEVVKRAGEMIGSVEDRYFVKLRFVFRESFLIL